MNLNKMLALQIKMDCRFDDTPAIHRNNCLWLVTELAEIANEWGEFKYRHKPEGTSRARLLEEYVDGLAVLLSLGLSHSFFPLPVVLGPLELPLSSCSAVDHFMKLIRDAWRFYDWDINQQEYLYYFRRFLGLGSMFNFTPAEIEEAYFAKQEKNLERTTRQSLLQPPAVPIPGPGPIIPNKPGGMA